MSDDGIISTAPPATPVSEPAAAPQSESKSAIETTAEPINETQNETEPAKPESPKELTAEELRKKFDRDAAMQRRRYEKDLQSEREARIRLEEQVRHLRPVSREIEGNAPKLEDYENFDEYVTAKAEFIAEQKIQAALAKNGEAAAAEKAKVAREQSIAGYQEKVAKFVKEAPDFHERMEAEANDIPMSAPMERAIIEFENGPKLAYYLLDHPDEAEKISNMTPAMAVRALTLIEEGFKKPVAVTQATPPITPVGSRSTNVRSLLEVTSQSEFEKRRREFIAKRN